jgi:hypothetical protein
MAEHPGDFRLERQVLTDILGDVAAACLGVTRHKRGKGCDNSQGLPVKRLTPGLGNNLGTAAPSVLYQLVHLLRGDAVRVEQECMVMRTLKLFTVFRSEEEPESIAPTALPEEIVTESVYELLDIVVGKAGNPPVFTGLEEGFRDSRKAFVLIGQGNKSYIVSALDVVLLELRHEPGSPLVLPAPTAFLTVTTRYSGHANPVGRLAFHADKG